MNFHFRITATPLHFFPTEILTKFSELTQCSADELSHPSPPPYMVALKGLAKYGPLWYSRGMEKTFSGREHTKSCNLFPEDGCLPLYCKFFTLFGKSVQGGWGGWPTGNKLSSSKAQLGRATFFPFPVGHPHHPPCMLCSQKSD